MSAVREILTLETFLPYRLSVLSNTVSTSIAKTYAERYDLSVPAWRVMAILGRFPGLSAAEVAERTAMDKVAVSRAVSQLLKAGRIERSFADDDRRRSVLKLSAAGWEVYDEVVPMALALERDLLETLSAVDRETLDRLIDTLFTRAQTLLHR